MGSGEDMAKDFSEWFYHSDAWAKTRAAFIVYAGGMCQRCMQEFRQGKRSLQEVKPIRIVHHRIYLTPENINDPAVSLSFDNLEGLCDEHHNREHKAKGRKYFFDKNGRPVCNS